MSTTGDRRRALVAGAALAVALAAGDARAGEELAGKVELSTVDIETLLDLPIESVSRRAESSADAPGAVFVITGEDLRAHGARTLADALRTVPGLFVYEDGLWPTLGVRGVGLLADYATRVLFLVDGHPIGDSLGMGRSSIGRDLPIPLAAVRRVEVIKGPVGAVYGPTAFLGVVNIVTQAPGQRGELVAVRGEGTEDGTAGAEVEAGLARGKGGSGVVAHASLYGTRGEDVRFPEWALDPTRPAPPGLVVSDVDTASAGNGYLRASALGVDGAGSCGWFTRRIPSAPYGAIIGDRRTHLSTLACFAQLSVDRRPSQGWEVGASAAYDGFEYHDAFAYAPPPDGWGMYRDRAFDRWASGELRARWTAPGGAAHLGVGARGAYHWTLQQAFADDLPSLLQDPVNGVGLGPIRKDFGTLDAWLIGDAEVIRALRVHAGTTFTANQLFGHRLTSKAAAVWHPLPASTLKVVYAEGFRAPTVAEAFYADGTNFLANPALRPELAQSAEVIAEQRLGQHTSVSASAFWNRYWQLIQFVTVQLPDGGLRQQAVNAGTRTVHGAEAAVTVRWGDRLQGWTGVSVQRTSPGGVPNAPEVIATAALSTRWPWRPLRLALHGAGTTRRDKDRTAIIAGERTVLPGYVVLGAAATLDVPSVPGLSIEASVANLLDARVLHPVTGDFAPISELPEAGRTYWVGVRWSR